MKKDKYKADDEFAFDETHYQKGVSLRNTSDFFNDDDYQIKNDVINVRRKATKKKEDWEIFKNGKSLLLLKGIRFSSKEREFLRTIEGLSFIIDGAKKGWKSVSEFKRQLEEK